MTPAVVRVGLLGCGTVGGAVARILTTHQEMLEARVGARLELSRVAVRDTDKTRAIELDPALVTDDALSLVNDPDIDIVVESIGGMEPAQSLIAAGLASGKHVVTANKELIAGAGPELMAAAAKAGRALLFEAAVGGGIPIIRPLTESLAGDRVTRVTGILNGTTNFILTLMSERGVSMTEALAQADGLGYTEENPAADIEGTDAASKLAILASIAFDANVGVTDVYREGIASVTQSDISSAHDLGYEVKLIALAELHNGLVSARVHPAMLPKTHPLSSVRDVFNAVYVEGREAGELMFYGRGAGGAPTASAIVGDVVEIARAVRSGTAVVHSAQVRGAAAMRPREEVRTRYYVVLSVFDQPGVLAAVAGAFAAHEVSIASVRQEGSGDRATLVLVTHVAPEGRLQQTFLDLEGLDAVRSIESRMRVEGTTEG